MTINGMTQEALEYHVKDIGWFEANYPDAYGWLKKIERKCCCLEETIEVRDYSSHFCLVFYTAEDVFYLAGSPDRYEGGYLDLTYATRFADLGGDLIDGCYDEETWNQALSDIIAATLQPLSEAKFDTVSETPLSWQNVANDASFFLEKGRKVVLEVVDRVMVTAAKGDIVDLETLNGLLADKSPRPKDMDAPTVAGIYAQICGLFAPIDSASDSYQHLEDEIFARQLTAIEEYMRQLAQSRAGQILRENGLEVQAEGENSAGPEIEKASQKYVAENNVVAEPFSVLRVV